MMPLCNPGLLPEDLGQGQRTWSEKRSRRQRAEPLPTGESSQHMPLTPGAAGSHGLLAPGRRQIPELTPVVSAISQQQVFTTGDD